MGFVQRTWLVGVERKCFQKEIKVANLWIWEFRFISWAEMGKIFRWQRLGNHKQGFSKLQPFIGLITRFNGYSHQNRRFQVCGQTHYKHACLFIYSTKHWEKYLPTSREWFEYKMDSSEVCAFPEEDKKRRIWNTTTMPNMPNNWFKVYNNKCLNKFNTTSNCQLVINLPNKI